eukprot:97169_1
MAASDDVDLQGVGAGPIWKLYHTRRKEKGDFVVWDPLKTDPAIIASPESRKIKASVAKEIKRIIAKPTGLATSKGRDNCKWVDHFIELLWLYGSKQFSAENVAVKVEIEEMMRQYDLTVAERDEVMKTSHYDVKGMMQAIYNKFMKHGGREGPYAQINIVDLHKIIDQCEEDEWPEGECLNPRTHKGVWQEIDAKMTATCSDIFFRLKTTPIFRKFVENWQNRINACPPGKDDEAREAYKNMLDAVPVRSKLSDAHHAGGIWNAYDEHDRDLSNNDNRHASMSQWNGDVYTGHSLRFDEANHYQPIRGEYNEVSGSGSPLLIGGVVGASAVVIIMLIFCLGLAFGMIIYWGYSQKRALDVKRNKGEMRNWIDDDEDRNEV